MSTPGDALAALLARARALEAEGAFPALVRLLEHGSEDDLHAEPELGYLLAYGLRRIGEGGRALPIARALEAPVRRRGDGRLERRLLNLHAMLLFDAGDVGAARRLWEQLAERAEEVSADDSAAMAYSNLGVADTLQGRLDQALAQHTRALTAYTRLGDLRGAALAHQNLAIAYRELGFHPDAERHFAAALQLAGRTASEDITGRAEEERAVLLLLQGDVGMATAMAGRARERLLRSGDRPGEGEALRVLGLCALRQRRPEHAAELLEAALARARESGALLLEAETLVALASVEDARGRPDAVARLQREAGVLFSRMGAQGWGDQVRSRVAALAAAGA